MRAGRSVRSQGAGGGRERDVYWNHNTAFHSELVRDAARRGGRVLDVGCGDGLLLARMVPVADECVGVETDEAALARARERLYHRDGVRLVSADVLSSTLPAELGTFQTVTCVAVLHHLPLGEGLRRLGGLVAPGGRLLVVGLAANRSLWDWVLSGLTVPLARLAGWFHHESVYAGMVTAPARESLPEVRAAAAAVLPGSRIRRRLYYRYTLTWDRPET